MNTVSVAGFFLQIYLDTGAVAGFFLQIYLDTGAVAGFFLQVYLDTGAVARFFLQIYLDTGAVAGFFLQVYLDTVAVAGFFLQVYLDTVYYIFLFQVSNQTNSNYAPVIDGLLKLAGHADNFDVDIGETQFSFYLKQNSVFTSEKYLIQLFMYKRDNVLVKPLQLVFLDLYVCMPFAYIYWFYKRL